MPDGAVVFILQKPIDQVNVSLRSARTVVPEQFLEHGYRQFGFCHSSTECVVKLVTRNGYARIAAICFQDELDARDG